MSSLSGMAVILLFCVLLVRTADAAIDEKAGSAYQERCAKGYCGKHVVLNAERASAYR